MPVHAIMAYRRSIIIAAFVFNLQLHGGEWHNTRSGSVTPDAMKAGMGILEKREPSAPLQFETQIIHPVAY